METIIKSGIYNLFRIYHNSDKEEMRLMSRFLVHDNYVHILEQIDDSACTIISEGPLTGKEVKVMQKFLDGESAYWSMVFEDPGMDGQHRHSAEELILPNGEWASSDLESPVTKSEEKAEGNWVDIEEYVLNFRQDSDKEEV